MSLLYGSAAVFWLLAETAIVCFLIHARVQISGRRSIAELSGWIGFFIAGCVLVVKGPALLQPLGGEYFGRRLTWDILCTMWIILEWAILYHLSRLIASADARYRRGTIRPMPAALYWAGIAAIVIAAGVYHVRMFPPDLDPGTLTYRSFLFVRLAGFAYIAIEAGLALLLYRAFAWVRGAARVP